MSGYPAIPARIAFGPEMMDVRAPVIPERDLSAAQMNLTFWQVAGGGRTLSQVTLLFNPVTPAILFQGLAFDPRQSLGDIPAVVNGTGDYTFTFATTYLNEQGTATSFTPVGAFAVAQSAAAGVNANAVLNGQDVDVFVFNAADAAADATVFLQVW